MTNSQGDSPYICIYTCLRSPALSLPRDKVLFDLSSCLYIESCDSPSIMIQEEGDSCCFLVCELLLLVDYPSYGLRHEVLGITMNCTWIHVQLEVFEKRLHSPDSKIIKMGVAMPRLPWLHDWLKTFHKTAWDQDVSDRRRNSKKYRFFEKLLIFLEKGPKKWAWPSHALCDDPTGPKKFW